MRAESETIAVVEIRGLIIPPSRVYKILFRVGSLLLVTALLCFRKDDLLLNQVYRMESMETPYLAKDIKNYERNKPGIIPGTENKQNLLEMRRVLNMEALISEAKAEKMDTVNVSNISETVEESLLGGLGGIEENIEFGYLEETGPREEAGKSDGLGEGEQEKEPDRTVPKVDIGEPFQTVVGDKPNPPDEPIEEEKPGDSDQTVEGEKPGDSDQTVDEEKPEPYPITKGGFLIDAEQMIVGIDVATFAVEDGYLELPAEDCVGIRRNAFASCTEGIVEIWIPENITVIESGAFCDIPELEWLEVSSAHPVYTSVAGVVYDREVSTLNVFPGARTGTFEVPGTVRRMESFAMDHTSLSGLDMRKCGEMELAPELFGDGTGEGIRVMVDGEWEEYYKNLFAPYSVEILGYHH